MSTAEEEQKQSKKTKTRKVRTFTPDMVVMARITEVLLDEASIGGTRLCQKAKMQYDRFLKYLQWLLERHYVENALNEEGKWCIRLTEEGREFGKRLMSLYR
jgi:predicted transcriptional regulator